MDQYPSQHIFADFGISNFNMRPREHNVNEDTKASSASKKQMTIQKLNLTLIKFISIFLARQRENQRSVVAK